MCRALHAVWPTPFLIREVITGAITHIYLTTLGKTPATPLEGTRHPL